MFCKFFRRQSQSSKRSSVGWASGKWSPHFAPKGDLLLTQSTLHMDLSLTYSAPKKMFSVGWTSALRDLLTSQSAPQGIFRWWPAVLKEDLKNFAKQFHGPSRHPPKKSHRLNQQPKQSSNVTADAQSNFPMFHLAQKNGFRQILYTSIPTLKITYF